MTQDLAFRPATELAELIRSGAISSVELTRHCIERIERFDGDINAVVVRTFERALEDAAAADAALARGEASGPLHGLPLTIKESYVMQDTPATWGIEAQRDNVAAADGLAVSRLRAAGAHFLGKTNVPVNLADVQSYNPIYGMTNNPWNLERTPGGSSGGSAAALAAGFSALEAGSDIGGSIRTPALLRRVRAQADLGHCADVRARGGAGGPGPRPECVRPAGPGCGGPRGGARRDGRSHRARSHRLAARVARTRVQGGGRAAGRRLGERTHCTGRRRDGGARATRGGRIREAWRDGFRYRTTGLRRTQGGTRLPEPPDRGDVERAAGEPHREDTGAGRDAGCGGPVRRRHRGARVGHEPSRVDPARFPSRAAAAGLGRLLPRLGRARLPAVRRAGVSARSPAARRTHHAGGWRGAALLRV